MIYYFDTNIFRDVVNGKITEDKLNEFLTSIPHTADCQVSPITIVELASHLTYDEKNKFNQYRLAFVAMDLLCNGKILVGPDSFLAKNIFNANIIEDMSNWEIFMERIQESKSLEDLNKKFIFSNLNGEQFAAQISSDILVKFREDYEQHFLEDMENRVITHSNPGYSETMRGVQNALLRKKLLAFVDSKDFKIQLLEALFSRTERLILFKPSLESLDLEKVMDQLCAFSSAYRNILKRIISTGYDFVEHKNDYADIHFLIYLMNPNTIFVTNDKKLRNLVDKNCEQYSRILTFEEMLKQVTSIKNENLNTKSSEWEKTVTDPRELKVFKALGDPKWDFRTLAGISKVSGLPEESVLEIIKRYPNFVRRSPVSGNKGEDLFTLKTRAISFKERFEPIRKFIIGGREW